MRNLMRMLACWMAMIVGVAQAKGSEAPPEDPVVTRHNLVLAGKATPYTAEVGRIPIRDVETGTPHGWMFYTAYRLPASDRSRALTFVWNGGPGADSSLLHFHVAGPRRVADGALIDNPQSWLKDTDLVFVDPVGTGFSRPAEARYAGEFYGTVGDVASVAEFVRVWRVLHTAEDAPLFLAGESWGAGRAANVGYQLAKRGIPVAGLVLISGGAGMHDPVPSALGAALRVVDFAASGLAHGKVAVADADHAMVERWARGTYAPAIEHPDALDAAARQRLAAEVQRYTGLPADRFDAKTLRVTPRGYRTGLLAAEGKTLGVFDLRTTSDALPSDAAPILRYLRHDLGWSSAEPYVGLEPLDLGYAPGGSYPEPVGSRWDYATANITPEQRQAAYAAAQASGSGPPQLGPPLPGTLELVALQPGVRVLVAAGRYDSLNSCTANDEFARRLTGGMASAVRFRCYSGGHAMYLDDAARTALGRDIAMLVAGTLR